MLFPWRRACDIMVASIERLWCPRNAVGAGNSERKGGTRSCVTKDSDGLYWAAVSGSTTTRPSLAMMGSVAPKDMPLALLSARCGLETERFFQDRASDPHFCFELFRRAIVDRDEQAWSLLFARYMPLVIGWVHRHPSLNRCDEEPQYFTNRAFQRMWSAVSPEKFGGFHNLAQVLRYLQTCVHSVILDHVRAAEQATVSAQVELSGFERIGDGSSVERETVADLDRQAFWEAVVSRLKDESERRVVFASFVLALKPREICARYGDIFRDVRHVYRVKENVLARLERDTELQRLLEEYA